MRRLEELRGIPHPELEQYKPVAEPFLWLQRAFFRLHRRRRYVPEVGMEPLSVQEITAFGRDGLRLSEDVMPFFLRVIEATDDAVVLDSRLALQAKRQSR